MASKGNNIITIDTHFNRDNSYTQIKQKKKTELTIFHNIIKSLNNI